MDYNTLLEMATDIGYRLAMSGAETFRVEESINRIMATYGIASEVFAIPNYLVVSIETADGKPMTRMRRIGYHGNDLDSVEKYSNLSRRICTQKPTPQDAVQWMHETDNAKIRYRLPGRLLGHFLGAAGFAVFFGGSLTDAVCAGICGILVGLVNSFTDKLKVNPFFSTIAASFLMAFTAYLLGTAGIAENPDSVVIGTLMILVPGLLFTNAMRDIIFGDTNSGVNRIVQVLLVAAAIALGTGSAWNLAGNIFGTPYSPAPIDYIPLLQCLACTVGCIGFSICFNIHGPGALLCALGGGLAWAAYSLAIHFGSGEILAYFCAAIAAAAYSEAMARIRKCPAISYLVIAIFPLIPGAGIYYTTEHLARGDMDAFTAQLSHTIAIAGVIAVGILMISTTVRFLTIWHQRKL